MSQEKKTSKSYSPYIIYSLSDGSYQFFTETNQEFRCLFTKSSSSFIDFPLESVSYDFAFYSVNKIKTKEDKRVGLTISKLLNDVLEQNKTAIISFICDNSDLKAQKRLKLFKKWFRAHNQGKLALLIEIDNLFYAGVILNNDHPEVEKIKVFLKEEKINFKKEKETLFEWEEIV